MASAGRAGTRPRPPRAAPPARACLLYTYLPGEAQTADAGSGGEYGAQAEAAQAEPALADGRHAEPARACLLYTSYAIEAGRLALQRHFNALGICGTVEATETPFVYRMRFADVYKRQYQ